MEAIECVMTYQSYLDEIQHVIKPEFQPVIDELRQTDPHDLVTPESWFTDVNSVKGFVWSLFMAEVKKQ